MHQLSFFYLSSSSDKGWNKLILIWCQLGRITSFLLPSSPFFLSFNHNLRFIHLLAWQKEEMKKTVGVFLKAKYTKMNFSWLTSIFDQRFLRFCINFVYCSAIAAWGDNLSAYLLHWQKRDKKNFSALSSIFAYERKLRRRRRKFFFHRIGKQTRAGWARSKSFHTPPPHQQQ